MEPAQVIVEKDASTSTNTSEMYGKIHIKGIRI